MKARIPYTKPSITDLEVRYAADAVANGWGERCYEYIERFEGDFKTHLGVKHAIATSSCTGALHMGMAALGIGPGDEVVLANTNWIATAAPVLHLGADPVLVDILPDTWCIDPTLAEAAITPRTKAIIAVHLYGSLCDMDRLRAVGEKYGIHIIEDAAEAIGSIWQGNSAGSMGGFGAFSFHGTKTISTGEGGMFVTNDDKLYENVLTLSNHGRSRSQARQFWPDSVGFKYKMSNIQAAIGCAQMERVRDLISRKRQIFHTYSRGLKSIGEVQMNTEPSGTQNGYWMPTLVFDKSTGITREHLQAAFALEKIDARVFFWPLSETPPLRNFQSRSSPVGDSIAARAINLPSFHDITEHDQQRVVDVIHRLYDRGVSGLSSVERNWQRD